MNISLPRSVLVKILSSSSFPVIQAWTGYPLYLQLFLCLTLCHSSLFSPAFPIIRTAFPLYHCCFVCFSTWVRASTSFLSCRYMLSAQPCVSELLQEPHRTQVLNIPTFSPRKGSRSPSVQSPISIQYLL